MKLSRLPALAVAIGLQLTPFLRTLSVVEAAAPSGFAVILRWLVGASAVLGSVDAVSAASAAIAGVVNTITPGPVSTNANGTVGGAFSYRIIVTNPGVNPQQAYWRADGLPAGLTINTNIGGNGYITGTPTTAGVYPVLLTAGNANYAGVVTKNITITITGGAAPPVITTPLADQTVNVGANVTFTVAATGSGSLSYVWRFGTTPLSSTSATLQLNNVQAANAGVYSVVVSDAGGSVTNSARLSVVTPLAITTQPQGVIAAAGAQVTLSVVAQGDGLTYDWRLNTHSLGLPSTNTLVLASATPAQSGVYSVLVSGSGASIPSGDAQVLVVAAPTAANSPQLTLASADGVHATLTFSTVPGFGYSVQNATAPSGAAWTVLTNLPPAYAGATVTASESLTGPLGGFYRVLVSSP